MAYRRLHERSTLAALFVFNFGPFKILCAIYMLNSRKKHKKGLLTEVVYNCLQLFDNGETVHENHTKSLTNISHRNAN